MKRILIAFLISAVGIGLSFFFLRPDEWTENSGQKRSVIAQVLETRNDVNRQEEGKLIWAPLRKGDIIYLGDKVKTSSLSSVFLTLTESTSRLEIEENSTVLMSGIGKKLTLNMLEGRVFLKQEQESKAETKVDLVSGGKLIDVQGDTAVTVSKDGTSQVDSFQKTSENLFSELEPAYGQSLLVTGAVELKWKPLAKDLEVTLEYGESPLLLKSSLQKSWFRTGVLSLEATPGIVYWRLVTKENNQEIKSPLMKMSIERPVISSPLSPANGEIVKLNENGFDFKWSRGNVSDRYVLEISQNQNFSPLLESNEVVNQTFFTSRRDFSEGSYFWRLKSQLPNRESLTSKVNGFQIVKGEKILSPVPLTPPDGSIFYLGLSQNITFEWKEQPNVRSYDLVIEGTGAPKSNVLTQAKAVVNLNRLGKYSWTVTSQSQDGKISTHPVKRSFEVRDLESVQWLNGEKKYFYLDNFPIIILKWAKTLSPQATLRIAETASMLNAQNFMVSGNDFPFRPMRDGFHYAQISLRDESGHASGESTVYEFQVEKAPLPPTPEFAVTEIPVRATTRGELSLKLKNGGPTLRVTARLFNSKGSVVDERNFNDDLIRFNSLLPGQYLLQVSFVDDYKRSGNPSARLEILVPEKSMIAAPKIKGIKVR